MKKMKITSKRNDARENIILKKKKLSHTKTKNAHVHI